MWGPLITRIQRAVWIFKPGAITRKRDAIIAKPGSKTT